MKYAVAAQRAWVVNQNKKLLMVKYIQVKWNPRYEGTWGLPGGKVDIGDSPEESLIKEIREETGIRILPGEPIGLVSFLTPYVDQKQIMCVIRRAQIVSGKLRGERQENLSRLRPAWIPLSRVSKLKLAFDEAAEIIRLIGLSGAQPLMQ